jgi:cation diffusion facilitator family transporter
MEEPCPSPGGAFCDNAASDAEKLRAAALSVLAAVFLTGIKLGVGMWSGSLGILSEAAHSGLDLVAAGMTYFAVRLAAQPADPQHPYGHGKFENLSALFETLLLLAACVWIGIEAGQRLLGEPVEIQTSGWVFAVMGVSIVVDLGRSRALRRVARKYDSQALEADALHFSTDVWSSLTVIAGLFLVWLSRKTGISWLENADAVAALGVAGIVVWVSLRLGRKTFSALLDEAPAGLEEKIRQKLLLPGVKKVGRIRVRKSGATVFVDASLGVSGESSVEDSHRLADQSEQAVRELIPGADVTVHVEPTAEPGGPNAEIVRLVEKIILEADAACHPHDILVVPQAGGLYISLHLSIDGQTAVCDAHRLTDKLEVRLHQQLPNVGRIVIHVEPTT